MPSASERLPASIETAGPEETEAVGARISAVLEPGDVVLVMGELGSGKTTLVRGACRALGIDGPVTSPTFVLGQRYEGAEVVVAHLDLYRLAGLAGEDPGLLDDYLGGDSIAFIEWPEVAGAEIPQSRLTLTLEHLGGDRRRIRLDLPDGRAARRAREPAP